MAAGRRRARPQKGLPGARMADPRLEESKALTQWRKGQRLTKVVPQARVAADPVVAHAAELQAESAEGTWSWVPVGRLDARGAMASQ